MRLRGGGRRVIDHIHFLQISPKRLIEGVEVTRLFRYPLLEDRYALLLIINAAWIM